MYLNQIENLVEGIQVFKDGEFDTFAQCIVRLNQRIITFLDDTKFINDIITNESITCVICSKENIDIIPKNKGIIISEEPRYTFFLLYNLFMRKMHVTRETYIAKNVKIGKNVSISDDNVYIGDNVIIGDNTVIEKNTVIENDVIIGPNCVIGSEGFEVKRRNDGTLFLVDHYGSVRIKEKTVLKSMVNIHKAVFDWDVTEIGRNCVIDSFTHIAHGNKIGNSILIGANCIISGNCKIEDYAYLNPFSCIAKRITVGKKSIVNIGSVVTKDVKENSSVTGNFAVDHKKWIEFVKNIAN